MKYSANMRTREEVWYGEWHELDAQKRECRLGVKNLTHKFLVSSLNFVSFEFDR